MKIEMPCSVIHGTLNPVDLIPTFINTLWKLNPDICKGFMGREENREVMNDFANSVEGWAETENAQWLLEDITSLLHDEAPEGMYFGAHPGDGSDFGFWEYEID
jgi:hypothetical protein